MKILFVLPWLAVGGLERVQVTIANKLVSCGHDVTVMTYLPQDDLKSELNPKVNYIYKAPKEHIGNKIPYIKHRFYDDGMWETRATPKELYEYYIGNEKYDVEIGFFRGRSIKIISGSTNKSSKKIAWVHSDFKLCGEIDADFKSMDDVKVAYQKFDEIITVSNRAKQSFCEVISDSLNIKTIYNMLPVTDIKKKSQEEIDIKKSKFTIISVGHLIDIKGFDRLLKVIKRLKEENLNFDLWIVGEGEDREKLEKYIKENNLKNVTLLGLQQNPYKYISKADLLVCSSRYEGFNLTVAEGLILEKPVLSTNCTGPTEILDDGKYGMIVENSEDGLYKGLKDLIQNPKLVEDYKDKAKLRKDFFDEDKILKEIENLF